MTSPVEIAIHTARTAFASGRTRDIHFRRQQIRQLLRMVEENEQAFIETLTGDLRKPKFETILVETDFVANDCRTQLQQLTYNTHDQNQDKNLVSLLDGVFVRPEPYGLVLVIGTWNYPLMVTLCPLLGAIAAGNCAIVKCSELAPLTGALLQKLSKQYLDPECYHVLNGEAEVSVELLQHRFDYIFFTGSRRVGKLVHQSAAQHLTPTTLELGGKSPVYVDQHLNERALHYAARRLLWGKMMNSGQTCVAPDYLLIHERVHAQFLKMLVNVFTHEFFARHRVAGNELEFDFQANNNDLQGNFVNSVGNIVNEQHFQRLANLLQTTRGSIVFGGQVNANTLNIPFTLVDNVLADDPLMEDELFGPILPVLVVKNEQEAIDFINSKSKPLSLYVFSQKNKIVQQVINCTSSGSVCVNDCILQLNVESLPFGGVGDSGFGVYHGKHSFNTFSHSKSVLYRNFNPILEWVASKRYPPYRMNYLRRLKRLLRKRDIPLNADFLFALFLFLSGIFACLLWQALLERMIY